MPSSPSRIQDREGFILLWIHHNVSVFYLHSHFPHHRPPKQMKEKNRRMLHGPLWETDIVSSFNWYFFKRLGDGKHKTECVSLIEFSNFFPPMRGQWKEMRNKMIGRTRENRLFVKLCRHWTQWKINLISSSSLLFKVLALPQCGNKIFNKRPSHWKMWFYTLRMNSYSLFPSIFESDDEFHTWNR